MSGSRITKPFYGYFIVAACFINLFMLWGMFINSFGIFMVPITEEMGWSREAVSLTLSVRSLGMALMAPLAGRMIDRLGARPIMAAGTLAVGLGLIAASRTTQLLQLHAVFFFAGCGLMCATMIPTSLIISNWFVSRRGTAMSVAFAGTGAGGAVMAPAANWVILNHDWRMAFALCGAIIVVVVVPIVWLVIRDRPSDIGLEPYTTGDSPEEARRGEWGVTVKEALSTRAFWLIASIMFIVALVANGIHNHCVPFLIDIGHEPTKAAYVWSFVMGVLAFSKLAFGPIADRWGARKSMAGIFVIFTASIIVLMLARPYWLALVFACLYGFACGGPLMLYALLTVDNLGIKHFGSIYGSLLIAGAIGSAIGPFAPGLVFTRMGTYLPIFAVFIILTMLGIVCALSIKSPQGHETGGTSSVPTSP